MKQLKKLALTLVIASVSFGASAFDAQNLPPNPPSGWSLVESYKNVKIYRKGNENTFVQVADMSQGASVKMYQYGAGTVSSTNKEPTYWINTIKYWWDQTGAPTTSAVSVINGQFFNYKWVIPYVKQVDPVAFSYGVKSSWTVLTNGGDKYNNFGYNLKQMNFLSSMPKVVNWTETSLKDSGTENAIVGLDRRANRDATFSMGRTYLCAKPYASKTLNQSISLLVIYSADYKKQAESDTDLNSWDCSLANTVMMDGSGSSKLYTKAGGERLSGDSRRVPQAIGIFN